LVSHEELAAASGEKLAAEKEEAMDEAYTQVGADIQTATDATLDVRLVSVLDRPSAALDSPSSAAVVMGASVSSAVRFHWQQAEAPAYKSPRTSPSASRFEWSQQGPNRLRLKPAFG
jgi:hypothetical protein